MQLLQKYNTIKKKTTNIKVNKKRENKTPTATKQCCQLLERKNMTAQHLV